MGYKRRGQLTPSIHRDQHFRKVGHRFFWKSERQAERRLVRDLVEEQKI